MARRASLDRCRCGTWTLSGLDRDRAALPVVAEAVPVTLEQVRVLMAVGVACFSLAIDGGMWALHDPVRAVESESLHMAHRCNTARSAGGTRDR
jgi:hypothetical protein